MQVMNGVWHSIYDVSLYGTAFNVAGQPSSEAMVDLRGTVFEIHPDQKWEKFNCCPKMKLETRTTK